MSRKEGLAGRIEFGQHLTSVSATGLTGLRGYSHLCVGVLLERDCLGLRIHIAFKAEKLGAAMDKQALIRVHEGKGHDLAGGVQHKVVHVLFLSKDEDAIT